jgi:hypothetical protein
MLVIVDAPVQIELNLDKYTHVALVNVDSEECIVVANFVEESHINERPVHIVGTSGSQGDRYMKLGVFRNAGRQLYRILLQNENFEPLEGKRRVVLHFK